MAAPVFNLNLFSNVASPEPAHNMAGHAARSFFAALAPERSHRVVIRLFVDPEPNPGALDAWVDAARSVAGRDMEVHRTRGLADGYLRSLELSEGARAMQLEHDFVLRPDRIGHDLGAIDAAMARAGIVYLRFSKRWNRPQGYDAFMVEQDVPGLPCCRTSGRSNNPHVIDLAHYRDKVAPFIPRDAAKAAGLEGVIDDYVGGGHVYGGLGHPAASGHLDGRRRRWRDALFRRAWLARAGQGAG